jgi:hypothetical protein
LDDPDQGSDIEEADVRARIRHRRNKMKRTFIDLKNEDNGAEVRVPFHKRRRDNSTVQRGRETLRLLQLAGVQPLNSALLRDLGYGGQASKVVIAAGASPAPGAPVVVPVPAVVPEAAAAVVDEDAMLED